MKNDLIETEKKVKRKRKSKKENKVHYVDPVEFEKALVRYYEDDKVSDYLSESIYKIAVGLSYAGNFINYSFKEDMVGDAVLKMYQAILHKKFKLNKGFSPFGYFTTIAFHAFICRIKKEKKHHEVIEEYKERNFDIMMNDGDEYSHKVYSRPVPIDKIDNFQ
jgi:hypothetical protein